jgi:hypothetical protein
LAAGSGAGAYAAGASAKAGRGGQGVGGARRSKEVATNGAAAAGYSAHRIMPLIAQWNYRWFALSEKVLALSRVAER